jgi:hypothetical protein
MSTTMITRPEEMPAGFWDATTVESIPEAKALGVDALRASDGSLPEHSETGPSAAGRIMACAGSLRLVRALRNWALEHGQVLPGDEKTDDSSRGDRLHALTAATIEHGEVPSDLNDEDGEAWELAVETIRAHQQEVGPMGIDLIEDRIDLSDCGAGFGTIDHAVIIPGDWGICTDLKFGARAVRHPRHNWQVILYGHGLCRAFGLRYVRLVICRPAADPEWQTMSWEADAETLAGLAEHYRKAVLTAENSTARLSTGEQCVFCPARQQCPARWACAIQVPRHGNWDALIDTMTPDELRELYERSSIAAQMFGALRAKVAERVLSDDDTEMTGYEAATGKGRREWADPDKAAAVLKDLAAGKGKDPGLLYTTPELKSPAQVEKVVGKSAAVVDKLQPLIRNKPGKTELKKVR